MVQSPSTHKEEQFTHFRSGFSVILRGVFESDISPWEASDSNWAFYKQFKQLYSKLKNEFPDDFCNGVTEELRLRLNFLVETTDLMESRMSVFIFLVCSAIRFHLEGDMILFKFLVEYCQQLHECEESQVRSNICCIVGLLFKNWLILTKGNKKKLWNPNGFSAEERDTLYSILRSRQLDKSAEVRSAVIRAASSFQEMETPSDSQPIMERSPKEIVLMGLLDLEHPCRQTAVQCIDLRSKFVEHIQAVVNLAVGDKNLSVRKEAIRVLGAVNPHAIPGEVILDLLSCTLTDCDKSIQMFTKETLLSVWLVMLAEKLRKRRKMESQAGIAENPVFNSNDERSDTKNGLASGMQVLVAKLDWENYPDQVTKIVHSCLDVIRRLIAKDQKMNLADVIKFLCSDPTRPQLINRQTQKKVKENISASTMALQLFVWRSVIQYCHERTKKGSDMGDRDVDAIRDDCFKRLVNPLKDTCETVWKVWQWKGNYAKDIRLITENRQEHVSPEEENSHNAAVLECLRVCTFLDRDPTGMQVWKSLLETMLEDQTLDKRVTDHITEIITIVHYTDPEEALIKVLNQVSDIVHKEFDPNATITDPTGTIAPQDAEVMASEHEQEMPEVNFKKPMQPIAPSDELNLFMIQVVSGMLKTGQFKKSNVYLQSICTQLVRDCLASRKRESRKYAIEVTAIICMADETMAKQYFNFIWIAFSTEIDENKSLCLDIFCDWIIIYGYDKVNAWLLETQQEYQHLTDIFVNIINSPTITGDVCFKAAECGAKMLLLTQRDPNEENWVQLCSSLLLRLFHWTSTRMPSLKACLGQFAVLFSANSRSNQMMLVNALCQMIPLCIDAQKCLNSFTRKVHLDKAMLNVALWTTEEMLTADAKEISKETNVHFYMANRFLDLLADAAEPENVLSFYADVLDFLDFHLISGDKAKVIQEKLTLAYEAVCDTINTKCATAKALVKMQKKFNGIFGTEDEQDEVRDLPQISSRFVRRIPTGAPKQRTKQRLPSSSAKKILSRMHTPEHTPEDPMHKGNREALYRNVKRSRQALFRD